MKILVPNLSGNSNTNLSEIPIGMGFKISWPTKLFLIECVKKSDVPEFQSLQLLCRNAILHTIDRDRDVEGDIDSLPLPFSVKKFLKFDYTTDF